MNIDLQKSAGIKVVHDQSAQIFCLAKLRQAIVHLQRNGMSNIDIASSLQQAAEQFTFWDNQFSDPVRLMKGRHRRRSSTG